MPFVNIQILKGHPQERKDEIARRVTATISELAQLPPEAIWVVFEDVSRRRLVRRPDARERAQEAGGRQMSVEIRNAAIPLRGRRCRRRSRGSPPASCSPKGRCGTPGTSTCCSATCRAITCASGRAQGGVTTFRKPCAQSNGLAWDRQGRLIVCEHATSTADAHRAGRHAARSSPAITTARS